MSPSLELCLIAVIALVFLDILIICVIIIKRLKSEQNASDFIREKSIFSNALAEQLKEYKEKVQVFRYLDMKQSIRLDNIKKGSIEKLIDLDKFERRQIKRLRSVFKATRSEAAVYLGLLGTEKAREALQKSILAEKNYPAKLYMANALSDISGAESIPVLVTSLLNSDHWYRDKVNMLISDFGEDFNTYLPEIINSQKIEIMELVVEFSSIYFSEGLRTYLINLVDKKNETLEKLRALYGTQGLGCCA